MDVVVGKKTDVTVLAAMRRAVSELEGARGSISVQDRVEFLAAYNALQLVLEMRVASDGCLA